MVDEKYDLIVVGGGIFGICAAWDATLRGLSVALVEKGDFAHGTSANCFKIVHGGVRYLQHADIVRLRASCYERSAQLRIAPHLVKPLPIVIPTYGHGMKGKEILGLGLTLYDLLTWDRNQGIGDIGRQIPSAHFISREQTLAHFPGLNNRPGLTGAAIFYDGQMYSPARLALSFLRSAVEEGAEAANYVEATGFVRSGTRVTGIEARDILTGEQLHVRGKVVLNCGGPWAEDILRHRLGLRLNPKGSYSRDAYFIVPRQLNQTYALVVSARTKDPDAILSRQARHLFLTPWRGYTLVGVWHVVHEKSPDDFTVTEDDLQNFVDEVNEAYPFGLTLDDVCMWHAGLVLFGDNSPGAVHLSYAKRSRIVDHQTEHGIEGLITLVGVRYTTARGEAARVIDMVAQKLGKPSRKCVTDRTPVYGGRIERFDEFLQSAIQQRPSTVNPEVIRALAHNHGSEYEGVLKYVHENPMWAETIGRSNVIKAEVLHAVQMEMAQKLGDVVFRRTDLGTGGFPGDDALRACADLMAAELGWNESRMRLELEEVTSAFPRHPCTAHTSAGSNRNAVLS